MMRSDVQGELLQAALAYAERGWKVVPLHNPEFAADRQVVACSCKKQEACGSIGKHPRTAHGLKEASDDPAVIRAWWAQWPAANIGIRTGEASGLVVIDIDPIHQGDATWKRLIAGHPDLPATLSAVTGSGGAHYYHRLLPGAHYPKNGNGALGDGVDHKSDNGMVVAPPSLHKSGNRYTWHDPRAEITPLPRWILDALAASPKSSAPPMTPENCILCEGARNDALFREVCNWRSRGYPVAILHMLAHQFNRTLCNPPLTEQEVDDLVTSALRYPAAGVLTQGPMTDLGNAERLKALYGGDLCHCDALGGWLHWDGARWNPDNAADEARKRAHCTARQILVEAAHITGEDGIAKDRREGLIKWARASESLRATTAMLSQAEPYFAVPQERFDADPWLLNCANGTIDLRTGKLRPHERTNYCRQFSPVAYDPHAQAPQWVRFLSRIFAGNLELIEFIRQAVGYTLTGAVSEQCLFFMYGGGANGKSTFVETLMALLGSYQQKAPTEMLTVKHHMASTVPNDIARLAGARMAICNETSQGAKFATARLKDLTGGDTITARFLRHEWFDFKPTHKLWIYGNHKPIITENDDGIWRRMRLIPFTVQIPEAERDPNFRERNLVPELPGILAWAVQGCLTWQQHGKLIQPAIVSNATTHYREEMDFTQEFIDCCCVVGPRYRIRKGELYEVYKQYCFENNEREMSCKLFTQDLGRRGYQSTTRSRNGFSWLGIALKGSKVCEQELIDMA
ncbi:MAG: phage/plasmid primase, P4 family [Armatimonadota bacterium]